MTKQSLFLFFEKNKKQNMCCWSEYTYAIKKNIYIWRDKKIQRKQKE